MAPPPFVGARATPSRDGRQAERQVTSTLAGSNSTAPGHRCVRVFRCGWRRRVGLRLLPSSCCDRSGGSWRVRKIAFRRRNDRIYHPWA